MNLYAINVAPVNGSETFLGAGNGVVVVAATGNAAYGRDGKATSVMAVQAGSNGILAGLGRSNAAISLALEGHPTAAYFAHGSAELSVQGQANSSIGALANGLCGISFGGRYTIPNMLPVPDVFYAAPLTRFMQAGSDKRLMLVAAEQTLIVRETRSASVQPEGRQA